MMRCDVCKGWTHLSCMRMKEVVGVVEGKEFVCHFCVAMAEGGGWVESGIALSQG